MGQHGGKKERVRVHSDGRSAFCQKESPCGEKVDIEEIDVRPTGGQGIERDPDDPEACEKENGKAAIGVFTFSRTAAFWRVEMEAAW